MQGRASMSSLEQLQESSNHRYEQEQEDGLQDSHHPRLLWFILTAASDTEGCRLVSPGERPVWLLIAVTDRILA